MKFNRKFMRLAVALLISVLLLCGCSDNSNVNNNETTASQNSTATGASSENSNISGVQVSNSDMFTDRDYEIGYDEDNSVIIELNGDSVNCSSNAVEVNRTTVIIKDEGTYIVRGTLNDGMLVVDAEDTDKPQLVLDNADITSSSSAAIYVIEADKVFVTLADDSKNFLTNGGEFTAIDENNIDGAVFSKQDITFNGSGSLEVISPAGHGIVCKDDLVFTSGQYCVSSASHALDSNDSVRVTNASLNLTAGKDGIHADNSDDVSLGFVYFLSGSAVISAEGDGISSSSYSLFDGGTINITAGGGSVNGSNKSSDNYGGFMGGGSDGRGGFYNNQYSSSESTESDSSSMKGIKSEALLIVNDGEFVIDSADDSVHSNTSVEINGGNINLASGDDGIHAEEELLVAGGNINITESYEGLEALNVTIDGGKISLVASDDGINAAGGTDSSGFGGRDNGGFGGPGGNSGGMSSSNGSIVINDGDIYIQASGDGIDSNGYLEITGGYTVVCGPTSGDTAVLDYDTTATISGGTFIGTGSYMMAQTFSFSENQGVIAVSVGNQSAGTELSIVNSDGEIVISDTPGLPYAILVVSSPDIKIGESYTVNVGTVTGEITAS